MPNKNHQCSKIVIGKKKYAPKNLTSPTGTVNDEVVSLLLNLRLFIPTAMRQYLLDELSTLERDNLDSFLLRTLKPGPITGVYWLEVPQDLQAPAQLTHPECGPFYFSVVLDKTEIRIEFLVRSSHNMRCSCIAWATPAQRQFLLDFIDNMIKEEFISV